MKSVVKLTLLFCTLAVGLATAADEFRHEIIGGEQAQVGQWPATVALASVNDFSLFRRQFCGGSLISETWVLTAAHCLFNTQAVLLPTTSFSVVTGVTDLDDEASATEIAVKSIVIHPFYDAQDLDGDSAHDIALIELAAPSKELTIGFYQGDPEAAAGRSSIVVGWGASSYSAGQQSAFPSVLNQLSIPLVSREVCNQPQSYDGILGEGQICAGFAAGGVDSCVGDSGGPLMFFQNGAFRQIGVVSFGRGCAEPNQYGVYTNVPFYATWIDQYTSGALTPGQDAPTSVLTGDTTADGRVSELDADDEDKVGLGAIDLYFLLGLILIAGMYASGMMRRQHAKVRPQTSKPERTARPTR